MLDKIIDDLIAYSILKDFSIKYPTDALKEVINEGINSLITKIRGSTIENDKRQKIAEETKKRIKAKEERRKNEIY